MNGTPTIFIHTNQQQMLGALLAAYSMKRASRAPGSFDVKLVELEKTPHLYKREGHGYLRKGKQAVWRNADLQSFSPLRRMAPQLMGYRGRALMTDPDVFAIGDVCDLLSADMEGKAILCRNVAEGYRGNGATFYASSVMLLDCEKLKHWDWDSDIDRIFAGDLDYGPWIALKDQDPATIGDLAKEWNSFDELTPETKLLHTTERSTQPWRTGLPVDFDTTVIAPKEKRQNRVLGALLGRRAEAQKNTAQAPQLYLPHPDENQERFIFRLMKDALADGVLDESYLRACIARKQLRADAFELLQRVDKDSARRTTVKF